MARADAGSVVPVKVLVEQQVIPEVRVELKLFGAAEHRPPTSLVAQDAIVRGRSVELSLHTVVDIPVEDPEPPLRFDTTWRISGGIAIPFADAARIPVTITYASDPNSLTKQKFMTGHIGLDYDFGALMKLFK